MTDLDLTNQSTSRSNNFQNKTNLNTKSASGLEQSAPTNVVIPKNLIKLVKRNSRSPVTEECDVSPSNSSTQKSASGHIRLVSKQTTNKTLNFVSIKNRSPESVIEAKIPIFKLSKNDISPEPHK